jgi:hypothetical protein
MGEGAEAALSEGLHAIHPICQSGMSEQESMRNAAEFVAKQAATIARARC